MAQRHKGTKGERGKRMKGEKGAEVLLWNLVGVRLYG